MICRARIKAGARRAGGMRQSVVRLGRRAMYPAAMLARAGLLLCLVVGSRQLSITEFVVPSAWEAGEKAELQCRYDSAGESEDNIILKWWWTSLNATQEKSQLYQRMARGQGVSVGHKPFIQIKGNDTIVLFNPTPAKSGTYECEVSVMSENSEEVRQHQVLTIFTQGTGPNLTISEVADGADADEVPDVFIECRADDVAPAPDLQLKVNGNNVDMINNLSGPDSDGLYDIVGNVTLSAADVVGNEVKCEMFYDDPDIRHLPYVDFIEEYDPSGAANSTDAPEDTIEPEAAPDSLQTPSTDSSHCCVSGALTLALGFLAALLSSSM